MIRVFIFVIVFLTLLILYVRYIERHGIFFPSKDITSTPDQIGLNYEDVYVRTSDGWKLNAWFVPSAIGTSTVLYLHGNAGNMGDRLAKLKLFHELGLNTFIIDYRGYGRSEGSPNEFGLYLDAQAALQYLVHGRGIDPKSVIVYGASLGGAPAVDLASKYSVGALVVDSSFSSAEDMAKVIYPFVPSFLISIKLDNIGKINQIAGAKLFIHSRDDEVVPYFLGREIIRCRPAA